MKNATEKLGQLGADLATSSAGLASELEAERELVNQLR